MKALALFTVVLVLPAQAASPIGFCGNALPLRTEKETKIYQKLDKPATGSISKTPWEFVASDGKRVPLYHWLPRSRPRAIVVASAGLDMGCSEFAFLGERLAAEGIAVWAVDMRGQGHEQVLADRGTKAPWQRWVKDVEEVTLALHKSNPGLPIFLTGQSTGDCVSLLAASRLECVSGLFLHSMPFVYLYPSTTTAIARFFLSTVYAGRRFSTAGGLQNFEPSFADVNDDAIYGWLGSPLRVQMTGRYLNGCFALSDEAKKNLGHIRQPILIQMGCKDALAAQANKPAKAPERFALALKNARVDIIRLDCAGHLLLREKRSRDETVSNDLHWLDQQINRCNKS